MLDWSSRVEQRSSLQTASIPGTVPSIVHRADRKLEKNDPPLHFFKEPEIVRGAAATPHECPALRASPLFCFFFLVALFAVYRTIALFFDELAGRFYDLSS